jgi:CheY-like chemotaxis protein/HPt (histidine-containing phosphotransfer) domain-containing protein
MLTSEAARGDGTRWRLAGLAGYALKPVNRAELFRVVCAALQNPGPSIPQPAAGGAEGKSFAGQKSMQILVAEDAPDNRLLVQAYLQASPHRLTFVEDGKSAVQQFAQGAFDLILMDIQMPLMDGLAATREIRAWERTLDRAPVPIVALTAHAGTRDIEQSRNAGCDAHLSKPISKDKLIATIARFASSEGQRPPIEIHPPEGLEDLVPGYLERQREEVAQCRLLLDAADFERIRYLAHNMKGSGGSFGFADLTRIGGAMEQAAKTSDRVALENYLAEVGDYFGRIRIVGPEPESLPAQG